MESIYFKSNDNKTIANCKKRHSSLDYKTGNSFLDLTPIARINFLHKNNFKNIMHLSINAHNAKSKRPCPIYSIQHEST